MKTGTVVLLGVAALGAALLFSKKGSADQGSFSNIPAYNSVPGVKNIVDAGTKSNDPTIRKTAEDFGNAPKDTLESIKTGIAVINSGGSIRTSKTITEPVSNGQGGMVGTANISGRIAQVTVTPAPKDSQGMTKLDKYIAENKARLK